MTAPKIAQMAGQAVEAEKIDPDMPEPGTLQHIAYMIGLHWDTGVCIDHLWVSDNEDIDDASQDEDECENMAEGKPWGWRVWSPPWIEDCGTQISLEVTLDYPESDDPSIALKPETETHIIYTLKDGKIVDETWYR
ncbi:MAG: hypothetical protein ABJO09_01670 [Hyphomicrobiales bacterium]